MAYVYRYTDLLDEKIKYVGIVWSENRTLLQRILEHEKNDEWCKKGQFRIEYITENILSRTDAEYFESHYISLYETDKYYNTKKSGWGVSSFLPERDDWILFNPLDFQSESENSCQIRNGFEVKLNLESNTFEIKEIPFRFSRCKRKKVDDHRHCKYCGGNDFYIEYGDDKHIWTYCKRCNKKLTMLTSGFNKFYKDEYIGGYVYDGSNIEEYDYYVFNGKHYGEEKKFYNVSDCINSVKIYGFDKEKCISTIKDFLEIKVKKIRKTIKKYQNELDKYDNALITFE